MPDKTLEDSQKREYPVVRPGLYEAELLEVNEGPNKFYTNDDGTPKIDVTFKFNITEDGEFEDSYVWGRTPPWFNTNPECKLRKWVQEVLGVDELPLGYELNYEDLVSRPVRIWVQHTSTGKAKVGDVLRSTSAPGAAAVVAGDDFGEEPF